MKLCFTCAVIVIALLSFCLGEESIVVTHKPDYLEIDNKDGSLKLSDIQHIISGLFGFAPHKEVAYSGILAPSPFFHPQATCVITVYGGDSTASLKGININVNTDEIYVPLHNVEHHLQNFYKGDSNILKIDLDTKVKELDGILEDLKDDEAFIKKVVKEHFDISKLNTSELEVTLFLRQVGLILQTLDIVSKQGGGLADLLYFEVNIPRSIDNSVHSEMMSMTTKLVNEVTRVMKKVYAGNSIVMAVSLKNGQNVETRKTRSLMATDSDAYTVVNKTYSHIATNYSPDYPVIFHIILWLVVFMALIVIYVMYGMMTMDPGSDSIIYRMTTTRLKKD